jgi:hypothetical protein
VAPVPEWRGRVVTVRLSRAGDSVAIRAGLTVRFTGWRIGPVDTSLH